MADIDLSEDLKDRKKPAGEKRKHSEGSSLSELGSSNTSFENGEKKKSRQQKKKMAKIKEQVETQNVQDISDIQRQLKQMNDKLSNVMTKNDGSIRQMIREIFVQMKEELMASMTKRIDILETRLFDKEIENDNLKQKIKQIEKDLADKQCEKDQLLEEIRKSKKNMDKVINEQEQYIRRNNIRINGVVEQTKETQEKTANKVCEILKKNLKSIGLDLHEGNIDIAHRIGKKKNGKRQIIVRFQSRMIWDKIMKNKKLMKGTSIFISEDLTSLNNHVLACVREKSPDEVENAWSDNGKILYEDKTGEIREVRFNDYQDWIDMNWPEKLDKKASDHTKKRKEWN